MHDQAHCSGCTAMRAQPQPGFDTQGALESEQPFGMTLC